MAALVAAEIVSSLGSLMSVVALPWFVLETTGSPSRMTVVLAAEAAPLALLGVPSGRVAGALGARRTLLACDAVWAPVMVAIPVLHFAGALSFPLLVALAFAAGLPWAAHYGSQAAVLPELLGEETAAIGRARALLQSAGRLTYFAGPVLGGLLLAAVGAPAVLLIDAGTFVASFALVATLVPGTPPPAKAAPREGGGLALIARDSLLRPLTIGQLLSQAAFMAMVAAVPVLAFTSYGRDPRLAGLLLAAWGGGAVLGGVAAYRLVGRHEPLSLGAAAWALQALPLWAMAGSPGPALAAVALALSGIGNGIRVPPVAAAITARIRPAMRAETLTVSTAIVGTGGLIALAAAAPALDHLGVGTVFAAVAATQTIAAAIALRVARAAAPQPQIAAMPRSAASAQNAGRGVRLGRITP
jgi:predicted MFS family arabinose efflux permease